jgi:hypothetical protein
MSLQALSWAIEQDLPSKPKLVLILLANIANPNGCCFFEPGPLARQAGTSVGGLWAYLAALERNEFINKTVRKTKRGEERDYWLAFGRAPGQPWLRAASDAAEAASEPASDDDDSEDDLRTDAYRDYLKNSAA